MPAANSNFSAAVCCSNVELDWLVYCLITRFLVVLIKYLISTVEILNA